MRRILRFNEAFSNTYFKNFIKSNKFRSFIKSFLKNYEIQLDKISDDDMIFMNVSDAYDMSADYPVLKIFFNESDNFNRISILNEYNERSNFGDNFYDTSKNFMIKSFNYCLVLKVDDIIKKYSSKELRSERSSQKEIDDKYSKARNTKRYDDILYTFLVSDLTTQGISKNLNRLFNKLFNIESKPKYWIIFKIFTIRDIINALISSLRRGEHTESIKEDIKYEFKSLTSFLLDKEIVEIDDIDNDGDDENFENTKKFIEIVNNFQKNLKFNLNFETESDMYDFLHRIKNLEYTVSEYIDHSSHGMYNFGDKLKYFNLSTSDFTKKTVDNFKILCDITLKIFNDYNK